MSLIQDTQKELTQTIEQYNSALSEINRGNFSNLPDLSEGFTERENGGFRGSVRNQEMRLFLSAPPIKCYLEKIHVKGVSVVQFVHISFTY